MYKKDFCKPPGKEENNYVTLFPLKESNAKLLSPMESASATDRWLLCVNSRSWLAIISRSEGADMLRRKTGCFTGGTVDLVSDTDLQAEGGAI